MCGGCGWGVANFGIDTKDTAVGLWERISWAFKMKRNNGWHTVWLLKVAMTLSAPSLLSKTISAMTIGCCFSTRQLVTMPPTGVMALSMSAAVVPGAKFCAITTNGPASPLMVMPLLNALAPAIIAFGAVGVAPLANGDCCC